jgi:hypothetical protein
VVAVLVMLSVILTASVRFPDLDAKWFIAVLAGGSVLAIVTAILVRVFGPTERPGKSVARRPSAHDLNTWRMPPLDQLPPARLSTISRIWMIVLRGYLIIAAGLVLLRIFQLATVGA